MEEKPLTRPSISKLAGDSPVWGGAWVSGVPVAYKLTQRCFVTVVLFQVLALTIALTVPTSRSEVQVRVVAINHV